jgi:hypothetical protein
MALAQPVEPLPHAALPARIAWLCHLTRAAAVGWAVWVLIAAVWTWSDPAKIASILGHYLNADLGVISPSEFAWACGVNIAAWIADAAVAYCIWRLFGTYLGGRIFTGDAALWLQRLGVAGCEQARTERKLGVTGQDQPQDPASHDRDQHRDQYNWSSRAISLECCFVCSCWRLAMSSGQR